jgi:type 1 glutamine amidotransferase
MGIARIFELDRWPPVRHHPAMSSPDARAAVTVLAAILLAPACGAGQPASPVKPAAKEPNAKEPHMTTSSADQTAILSAVRRYLDGAAAGDRDLLLSAFAADARMQSLDGERLVSVPIGELAARVRGAGPSRRDADILRVDVTGGAAVVTVRIVTDQRIFLDYLTLLRADGEWRIMHKVFHATPRGHEAAPPAPPVRALVLTGGFEYPTRFYDVLESDPGAAWTHVTSEAGLTREALDQHDVLVLYYLSRAERPDGELEQRLRAFLESGKGLVVVHSALGSWNGWQWWREVVGGAYRMKAGGEGPASKAEVDQRIAARVLGDHPVTRGVDDFTFLDETYRDLSLSPSNQVLVATDGTASDDPLVWVSAYRPARVVVIQPGHARPVMDHPSYRRLVRQAIRWAARRE